MSVSYRGRFAPTPTGPLHLGSLVTAMASFLEARQHRGDWLLRIDDLDQARCRPDAAAQIIQTLHRLGFHWQEPVQYQHQHQPAYLEALARLHADHLLYACHCSRQQLRGQSRYSGTCRTLNLPDAADYAVRIRTHHHAITVADKWQGVVCQRLAETCGDFVVRRRDGVTAYQLAVVVDDQMAGVTHVVRGADLLESCCRQVYLQQRLGYTTPAYQHVPLVLDNDGKKLSKSDAAQPIVLSAPLQALRTAWLFLQPTQIPPDVGTIESFWRWATTHWRGDQLSRCNHHVTSA
ncbi:MAG: tRNA glutamyl-Q(34) synthetase GluQRS [Pseudomonadota bacterium]